MATKDIKARILSDYEAKIAEVNKVCSKGTAAEVEGKLAQTAAGFLGKQMEQ